MKKCVPNCTSPTTYTTYIFSGSKVVAEYDNGAVPTSPSREYLYSGATLLAKIDSSGTSYYHQDHLSNRVTTDSNGNLLAQQGHFPFGEQWYPAPPTAPPSKWLFTSYERDAESGNDYATMRYGINRLGRLSSPDLVPGSFANPQSLGRFAYVLNDPINLIDPWGLDPAPADPCATDLNQCVSVNTDSPSIDIPYVQPWGSSGIPLLISPARDIPIPAILSLQPSNNTLQTRAQKCAAAQAKVANLKQQLQALQPNQLFKANLKELAAGAVIGCGVTAVGETFGTGGLGAPFAPGACAVGAVGGAMTAEGVFVLANASEIWNVGSTDVQLTIAAGQATLACHP